jgi:methyl-branched lipid omega-hydroxylase
VEIREVLDVEQIDLSDMGLWARPIEERDGAFATLRRERPISFHRERPLGSIPPGPGYWALTRHHDVLTASKNPDIFCSGQGSNITDLPPEFLEFFGSMINMDDPRHARLRKIVSGAFTPGMLRRVEDQVVVAAREVLDRVIEKGECDFVTDVAAVLPLRIICDMLGVPESQHEYVFDRSNVILGAGDPEYVATQDDPDAIIGALLTAGAEMAQLMEELAAHRREHPTDDLTTALMHAEVDGDRLTQPELNSFFILLLVAGNETTRNAISHALWALTQYPDQKRWWMADVEGRSRTAVEEIVRWATPVIHFRRTVTCDTELSGQALQAGEKVVLFYNSANRDEAVFDRPFELDLGRTDNPHVGFGGPGPHFCLGANLARREISVMWRELFARVPDIEATELPAKLHSNFIHGIKHLPCRFTPGRPSTA